MRRLRTMTTQSETPTTHLARIVQPLEPSKAAIVRESFGAMFSKVEEWQDEARPLLVTAEDQIGKMKRARILRLEIRAARVELDKRRKSMKAGILLEGRAIDGAFAIFESLTDPIERHLLEQEQFAEREQAKRRDALRDARKAALSALDVPDVAMPAALGEMSEEAWGVVLENAQGAKAAREEAARMAEAARIESARIIAEQEAERRAAAVKAEAERQAREVAQREDNDRLKSEAEANAKREREERAAREVERQQAEAEATAERKRVEDERQAEREKAEAERLEVERKGKVEREAIEATAREEKRIANEARQKAEAEATALRKAEAERVARDAEAKKPTKAKYASLVDAMKLIASQDSEPNSRRTALKALVTIGEINAPTH